MSTAQECRQAPSSAPSLSGDETVNMKHEDEYRIYRDPPHQNEDDTLFIHHKCVDVVAYISWKNSTVTMQKLPNIHTRTKTLSHYLASICMDSFMQDPAVKSAMTIIFRRRMTQSRLCPGPSAIALIYIRQILWDWKWGPVTVLHQCTITISPKMRLHFTSTSWMKLLWKLHGWTATSLNYDQASCTLHRWIIPAGSCVLMLKYRRNVTMPERYPRKRYCKLMQTRRHYTLHYLLLHNFI